MKNFYFNSALRQNSSFSKITKNLVKLFLYYCKLQWGIASGKIFFKGSSSNAKEFSFQKYELKNEIDDWIISIIRKDHHSNHVDISKKQGLEHIGYGCFATPILGKLILLTQGEATFFFVTEPNFNYLLKIKFETILKIKIKITVDGIEILQIKIPSLTEKSIIEIINSSLILNNVTKISISTSDLWSPHFIERSTPEIPVGVGIEKISLEKA